MITKPPNRQGDNCATGQVFCGFWYKDYWDLDDMSSPDLEDWRAADYPGDGSPPFWHNCMFLEL